jgi:putative ABC transport system ATP-binding protein
VENEKIPVLRTSEGLRFLDIITYPGLAIGEGTFTFITGKSGCGKSTLLRMLNRTVIPSAGDIFYRGEEIRTLPVLPYRREVMLVPQEVFLFDGSIRDNFDGYCAARGKPRPADGEIREYLRICCADFSPQADCAPLSGGEKQRVFLAVFLSCAPRVLLLDEPTAALDEKTSEELLRGIKDLITRRGMTAVCVCHNEELVAKFADDTIHLGADS